MAKYGYTPQLPDYEEGAMGVSALEIEDCEEMSIQLDYNKVKGKADEK